MPRGNEPLGEVATVVLFENDLVKIWNLIVEPGETGMWHHHTRPYATVMLEGTGITVEHDDGTIEDGPSTPGHWTFHDEPDTHRVINNTNTRFKNILIEIKK